VELIDRVAYRLKLRDLRLLDVVVRSGSMAQAALQLNISQPAVSKAIAELEHVLGIRLVDRSRQGIEPTVYGRVLLDCGVAVFDELRQAVQKIEFLVDPSAGEVRIGCHPFLAASFVSAVVDRVAQRYPRIVFRLEIAEAEKLQHELSERNVDFIISRRWTQIADERMSFEFLFDESFVVVTGAQNPWVRRRRIALSELMDEPWVLPPPESGFGLAVAQSFRSCGLDYPRATVVTTPPEVRISLLATGRYLTIFPASALRFPTRRAELKVLPVELPIARVPSGIVTLNNRTLSPVALLFVEGARELAKTPQTRRR
jgi:DNA-binding transcriptional LysR family regulator